MAGMQSGRPVRRSNRAPWRGQVIEQFSTGPSVKGCPSCEQTSSTAKNSSPIRIKSEGMSSTRMESRPPVGISSTDATRSNSDIHITFLTGLTSNELFSKPKMVRTFARV